MPSIFQFDPGMCWTNEPRQGCAPVSGLLSFSHVDLHSLDDTAQLGHGRHGILLFKGHILQLRLGLKSTQADLPDLKVIK